MTIRLLTAEERKKGHDQFQEKFAEPPVRMANVQHAALLDTPALLPFHGKLYEVAPISVPDGFVVSDLVNRWDMEVVGGSSAKARETGMQIFNTGCTILHRLTDGSKPYGSPRWMPRFLYKNVWRTATEEEFVLNLRFLLLCRMK